MTFCEGDDFDGSYEKGLCSSPTSNVKNNLIEQKSQFYKEHDTEIFDFSTASDEEVEECTD